MENASKALIIAGAVLITILIIGLGMYIYNQAANSIDSINLSAEQIRMYNSKFLQYEGKQSGARTRDLCNLIRNHNKSHSDDGSLILD